MDIHPAYQERLEKVLGAIAHERQVAPREGAVIVRAERQGITLTALIRSSNHVVLECGFEGASTPVDRGLMESLCSVMENKPIQECADHAAIQVEKSLRSATAPPPVRGLVTPDNADPRFVAIQAMMRELLAAYRTATGYSQTQNFFDHPISPRWKAMSDDQRLEAIQKAIDDQGWSGKVRVLKMEGWKRVVVEFAPDLQESDKQDLPVKLDEMLRANVESTLQTLSQVRRDINVVRIHKPSKNTP